MDEHAATVELHRLLTAALDMADHLGLTMTAIRIDEARNLLVPNGIIAPH